MGRQAKIKAERKRMRAEGKLTLYDMKQMRHQQEWEEQKAREYELLQRLVEMQRKQQEAQEKPASKKVSTKKFAKKADSDGG